MSDTSPHTRLSTRRWLKAVTLMMGVIVGLTFAISSVCAMQSSGPSHSCCCDHADTDQDSQKQKASKEKPCKMATPADNCPCHIDRGEPTPAGDVLALSAGSFSFAPAVATTLHPQLDIQLARAPSVQASVWLYGLSPPAPLYLLHETLLI